MSKVDKLKGTNPFSNIDVDNLPEAAVTDYHKDTDDYIIEYTEVDHLVEVGDSDTDFVIKTEVEECSRVKRDEYIESFRDDVGILNILEKVRRTGDTTLLNQVSRKVMECHEKDALGRPVEDIVDITPYQVDKITALEAFKKGTISFKELPEELRGKLSMKEAAQLSDHEIDMWLASIKEQVIAAKSGGKVKEDESSK